MKILLIELWGLGDAVMMSSALRLLVETGASVTLLCKPSTVDLLKPSYPTLDFILLDAPWTVFKGKYRLGSWPWKKLFQTIRSCRQAGFDAVASVRPDPRDHLLMFLSGIPIRIGFPKKGSGLLLTHKLAVESTKDHKVDDWKRIGATILSTSSNHRQQSTDGFAPYLNSVAYVPSKHQVSLRAIRDRQIVNNPRPIIGLHCGARITVRRWEEKNFEYIIKLLRQEADFHLALFPDIDGYGRGLISLADSCHEGLSIQELVADLAASDFLICNDSGPGHIAAALGRPVLAIFGPTNPDWFRPFGKDHHVVIRDICPFRPCFDYCRFPEPKCLTQLTPDLVWPEIRSWFQKQIHLVSEASS